MTSISSPPASDASITATLNHSHCWLMKAALALCRWPFSTSNAPHTVLDAAIAIEVSSSAKTRGVGASTWVVHTKAATAPAFATSR